MPSNGLFISIFHTCASTWRHLLFTEFGIMWHIVLNWKLKYMPTWIKLHIHRQDTINLMLTKWIHNDQLVLQCQCCGILFRNKRYLAVLKKYLQPNITYIFSSQIVITFLCYWIITFNYQNPKTVQSYLIRLF